MQRQRLSTAFEALYKSGTKSTCLSGSPNGTLLLTPDPTSRKDEPDLHTHKCITPPSTLLEHPQKLSHSAKIVRTMSAIQSVSIRPAGQVAGVRARVQPTGTVKAITRRVARVQLRATADPTVRHRIQRLWHSLCCLFGVLPTAGSLQR